MEGHIDAAAGNLSPLHPELDLEEHQQAALLTVQCQMIARTLKRRIGRSRSQQKEGKVEKGIASFW